MSTLARLTTVELRKMTDTRAGRWLLAVAGLIAAAIVVVVLSVGEPAEITMYGLFGPTLFPLSVFLPILGILAVTAEWTHRTALTTFTMVPVRSRVAGAKLAASVVLGLLAVAVSLTMAAVGNLLGAAVADGDGSWQLTGADLGKGVLFLLVNMLMGVGFGMLLMNAAFAIVLVFVLPTLWSVLTELVHAVEKPAQWLDISVTSGLLIDDTTTMHAGDWAKLGVSVAAWVVLPLALGLVRLLRREVT
jgi:ABC-2 type transport system permease protein